MTFNKLNNITGWLVFVIAMVIYTLTVEPTASFWDCGEFIATSYKLMVPHPPGAPFFLLVGRLFSLFASDVEQVAFWVNMVSVTFSALTSILLFWVITILSRKILGKAESELSMSDTILVLGSGLVGALAYTVSDTAWFSAAETEVYAMSSFFTAFVFWAILKWERVENESDANKWLLLIAYMVGLSIGVHLLNLLSIPALGLVYYFKKFDYNPKGVLVTLLVSAGLILVVLVGVIPGLPSIAGSFEIFFVNSLGMPFSSGIIVFVMLFIAAVVFGIRYSYKTNNALLNTAMLSLVFIVIGYSSYGIVLVRSNFNPPIDENDPENIISFVSYLKREQYGDRPLLKGPTFLADVVKSERTTPLYRKADDKYVIYDYKVEYTFDPKNVTFLPRMYDKREDRVQAYYRWANLPKGKKPTLGDQIVFMFRYQLGHMWFRYFMWNFSGRESNIQDANWIGPFASQKDLPPSMANNPAWNQFYMLPLILGLFGLFYHFKKNTKDASVVMLMFFFTGAAVILYLNQPPNEPRERDYTSVGSFYVFSIWIGLGAMAIADYLKGVLKTETLRNIISVILAFIIPVQMVSQTWDDHDRSGRYFATDSAKNLLNSCAKNAILFTGGDNDTFPLWYVQNVEGFRTDVRVVVLSYLTADWYIKELKEKQYDSEALPITFELDQYIQGTNDAVPYVENPRAKGSVSLPLLLKLIKEKNPAIQVVESSGRSINSLPAKNIIVPIDKEKVRSQGIVPRELEDQIVDQMVITVKGNYIFKNDLMILEMIHTGNWERPIYFNNTSIATSNLNIRDYMQMEGMTYRLLPVKNPSPGAGERVHSDIMYDNMMNNMFWRNLDNPSVYYDEEHIKFALNSRSAFARLANQLYTEGKIEQANEVVQRCLKVMPHEVFRYDVTISAMVPIILKAGNVTQAEEIADYLTTDALAEIKYLRKQGRRADDGLVNQHMYTLNLIQQTFRQEGTGEKGQVFEQRFNEARQTIGI